MVLAELPSLTSLTLSLKNASCDVEKLQILDALPSVQEFFQRPSLLRTFLSGLSSECELAFKSVIAIEQQHIFSSQQDAATLRSLLEDLLAVEKFYKGFGGIVGYQWMMLELFKKKGKNISETASFLSPEGLDISRKTPEVRQIILEGILRLPEMGEIYPLGGAGDRLSLIDEKTKLPLPAASLQFCGKSLLTGLIDDLQAREHLYFKLTGKRVITPVAIMTSRDKENHPKILSILEENEWFDRPKESFRLFRQPLVPVMDQEGRWCLKDKGSLLMKPGGHGVIWKLAKEEGVFDWFYSKERKKTLLRQVNNPIAGLDDGLLAFTGLGLKENKMFGFASCQRLVGAKEGMNVLIEKKTAKSSDYVLTNIEYCDFKKHGLEDKKEREGSPYSQFPSNTNILFVDLPCAEEAAMKHPVPGMLINSKSLSYIDHEGRKKEGNVARLESTMQNIADYFWEEISHPFKKGERDRLKTFVTFNERAKTISCTKRKYSLGNSFLETPEGCFVDVLKNARELLVDVCGWKVPRVLGPAKMLSSGPSFIFLYHPMLGPLYSLIGQKIRKGSLALQSELQLSIHELDMEEISIDGSVRLFADSIEDGKCTLRNVTFSNQGIDYSAPNCYWKNEIQREESFTLTIKGSGEFFADNVRFEGNFDLVVEDGMRLIARQNGREVEFVEEKISAPTWQWKYAVDDQAQITITK